MRDRKSGSQWKGRWEEPGRSRGMGNGNQDILSKGKTPIFNKMKKKKKGRPAVCGRSKEEYLRYNSV